MSALNLAELLTSEEKSDYEGCSEHVAALDRTMFDCVAVVTFIPDIYLIV